MKNNSMKITAMGEFLNIRYSRHCERSEAIQDFDKQWIASGCYPRNDVCRKFLEVSMKFRGSIRRYAGAMLALPVIMIVLFASCERRFISEDELLPAALISVAIDWNSSGIDLTGGDGVHSVSIRFFPKSAGGSVFDCYLESNVREGEILVPPGKYSVIVFNESIHDATYWADRVTFTDVNSYTNFAANAVPLGDAARQQQFPYYKPQQGERFIVQPLRLASWSLDDFEVTENMVLVSQGRRPASSLSVEENNMFNALKQIKMRSLIRPVSITAKIENLVSAQTMYFGMRGLANKVNMATGITTSSPSTYLFILNGRQYDSNQRDGTAGSTFLCFGRTPAPESYSIAADILLISNVLHEPAPLLFNVTNQITSGSATDMLVNLNITFNLPFIEGGVAIDDWGDDEQHTVIEK